MASVDTYAWGRAGVTDQPQHLASHYELVEELVAREAAEYIRIREDFRKQEKEEHLLRMRQQLEEWRLRQRPFGGWLLAIRAARRRVRGPGVARGLMGLAAWLAGPRRAGGYREWLADLAGSPEEGRPLRLVGQLRYAAGLLWAAIRMRLGDIARWVGRRLDWVMATEGRLFAVVVAVVVGAVLRLLFAGGLMTVLQNGENVAAIGGGLWAAGYVLRKVRGVAPTPRKPDKKAD